jgi:hypothetical protein
MLFTSAMPTHAEKNRGGAYCFLLKLANIAAFCLCDRAAGRFAALPAACFWFCQLKLRTSASETAGLLLAWFLRLGLPSRRIWMPSG